MNANNRFFLMQEQYKFVYDTLEEFVICGTSWFPVSELSQRLKQKSIKSPVTKINEYQREYQQICKQTPRFTIGDCAGGHRADNREKNRDVLVVPRKFRFFKSHSWIPKFPLDSIIFLLHSRQLSAISHKFPGE